MRARPRRLVARVVTASATVAAVAGLVGASLASVVAYYFLRRDEDARLMAAAEHAKYELIRDGAAQTPSLLPELLAVEAAEIEPAGLRIGVVGAEGADSGSYRAGPVEPGTCGERARELERFRACGVAWGSSVLVVASSDLSISRFRRLCGGAAFLAATFSMMLGVLVSRRAARSAMAPLTGLHERLLALPPLPKGDELGSDQGIVEVDALRRALARLLERQAIALERSRNFAADAAHELRTPLTTLRAKVDILLEQTLDPVLRDEVQPIQREVTRLAHLVERLLVLAMPEEDVLRASRPVSLPDLVEEVVAGLPAERRARIEFASSTADPCLVDGDPALLELAVANLLDNALKYSSERITARVAAVGETIAVEITDRGPGIPEHERARLFQPFHRGAGARHVRGHGIGLAIVARVATSHRGNVSVDGEQGLRVTMSFPRLAQTAETSC